ncbi:unnamed protein product [Schistosoma margrebowiei]|uniref:Uncharacterized protein n=1 Tax=Schistosoma margrebowiei TaxID=48269 RepID=A0A183LJI9_9TREM|nr:unnamed protein product [Schistosoma margrebowiei]
MGWCLTKSQHGFGKLVCLLPTCVTYDEGEIFVYQLKNEYTVRQFVLSYITAAKCGH